jgi:hypothetical protein
MDFKQELFGVINDFKQNSITIDWEAVWNDEEKFDALLEALDALINSIALLSNFDHSKRAALVAQLAIGRAQLTDCFGDEDRYNYFQATTQALEHAMRDTINASDWLQKAHGSFDEYLIFEDTVTEDTEITRDQIDHYRPVMTALALMNIITIDQEEECDDEECDDE